MATDATDQKKGKENNVEGHDLKFELVNLQLHLNDSLASCKLRIPSVLPSRDIKEYVNEHATLDLIPDDQDRIHCLTMMRETVHPSILHARVVMKIEPKSKSKTDSRSSDNWAVVEPCTGILLDYLKKDLCVPKNDKSDIILLPTVGLQSILRQIVDGLEYLMISGYYHGNFKLKTTFYHEDKVSGHVTVKLAAFKKKGGKKSICHKEDLLNFGEELDEIATIAADFNKKADITKKGPRFDAFQISDLAKKLKNVTEANLGQMYQEIKGNVVFWEMDHRKRFFIYRVALAMETRADFKSRIAKCKELCALPWNGDSYDGFLQKMNQYRRGKGRELYDGTSTISFVEFIVGLYTHEHVLKHKTKKVDEVVTKRHPHLCVILKNLLGSDDVDWL